MNPPAYPLSLPAGTRSKRRALLAAGVVVLVDNNDRHGPVYLGNWQPTRETPQNPKRTGATWLPVHVIDW